VSGAHNATLRYDPLGRLYEIAGATGTTRFLYDGDALVAEYDTANALLSRYVHGSNAAADDPLIWYGAGARRWLHADHQGSIVAITNGAGGISSINTYDDWGIPSSVNAGRFRARHRRSIRKVPSYARSLVDRAGFEPAYGKPGQIYSLLPLTTRPPVQWSDIGRRVQWRKPSCLSTPGERRLKPARAPPSSRRSDARRRCP